MSFKEDLKERLKGINKKNVAIIAGVLFLAAVIGVVGFEYGQMHPKVDIEETTTVEEEVPAAENTVNPAETAAPTKKPSEYKIGISYEAAMKGRKPVVALFYADWCHYCINFMPTFEALSKVYKKDYNFTKVNVEDPKYDKLVKDIGITGFPTVFLLDPKYDNRVLLSNSIFGDMNALRGEIDRFLRIRKLLDKRH